MAQWSEFLLHKGGLWFRSSEAIQMLGGHGGPAVIRSRKTDRIPKVSWLLRLTISVSSGFDGETCSVSKVVEQGVMILDTNTGPPCIRMFRHTLPHVCLHTGASHT